MKLMHRTMQDLKTLETETLMDMLAEHTHQLVKMFSTSTTHEDYINKQAFIKKLQEEIRARKGSLPPDKNDGLNFEA